MTWESTLASALFQRKSRLSAVPPATNLASGDNAALLTAAAGPANAFTCAPLAKVESRTVLSALAVSTEALSTAGVICGRGAPGGGGEGRRGAGGAVQRFGGAAGARGIRGVVGGGGGTACHFPGGRADDRHELAVGRVPEAKSLVGPRRGEDLVVGAEDDAVHRPLV